MKEVSLSSFYRCTNRGSERLRHFSEVTQVESSRILSPDLPNSQVDAPNHQNTLLPHPVKKLGEREQLKRIDVEAASLPPPCVSALTSYCSGDPLLTFP